MTPKETSVFQAIESDDGNQSEFIVVSQSPPPEIALGTPQAFSTTEDSSGEVSSIITEIPDVKTCGRPFESRN